MSITGFALAALLGAASSLAAAAPVTYEIDPDHTYPSFEADHMGVSVWRGKLNKSSGTVIFDRGAGAGSVAVSIDLASIDFGQDALNQWAIGAKFFDIAKFPTATYRGNLAGFSGGAPTKIRGELTLHGVTRPVELKINSYKCVPHPMAKRELCGADALATIRRDEFGLDAGKAYGFDMNVVLRIQLEALGPLAAAPDKPGT